MPKKIKFQAVAQKPSYHRGYPLLKSKKKNIQPFISVIGDIEKKIEAIFVYFDDIKYMFSNVVRAYDTLFKIYHLFQIEYPKPCETFLDLIEVQFFEL